jgi:hypothetical protein
MRRWIVTERKKPQQLPTLGVMVNREVQQREAEQASTTVKRMAVRRRVQVKREAESASLKKREGQEAVVPLPTPLIA